MKYYQTKEGVQFPVGRSFTTGGFKYPRNWISLSTAEEREAIGLVEFEGPDPEPVADPTEQRLTALEQALADGEESE